jgi:transposase-like protein
MTRSKLSDLEKQEIVSCFEQQQDTILGLAERYQVSSSTIRRLLKQSALDSRVEESKAEEFSVTEAITAHPESTAAPPADRDFQPEPAPESAPAAKVIILDKKPKLILKPAISSTPIQDIEAPPVPVNVIESRSIAPPTRKIIRDANLEPPDATHHLWSGNSLEDNLNKIAALRAQAESSQTLDLASAPSTQLRSVTPPQEEMSAILTDLGSNLTSSFANTTVEEEEDDDSDDDGDDFDDDDYDGDEDDSEEFSLTGALQLQPETMLEVMPFAQAVLPKICYIVVDRTAELVTRPLKDFGDLGQIPADEVQSCTLPVFDNHRIARRFSHRTQRIIKVPNGNMLRSACTQLSAKGITRLLINGHIYAL